MCEECLSDPKAESNVSVRRLREALTPGDFAENFSADRFSEATERRKVNHDTLSACLKHFES